MQFLTIVSALFATAAMATKSTHITFWGAADGKFDMDIPINGDYTPVTNVLSITYVQVGDGPAAHCISYGINGAKTYIANGHTVPVGPPQTQVGIQCWDPASY